MMMLKAVRSMVLFVVGLALLSGCAAQTALTKPARESLQAVSINQDVTIPDDIVYQGPPLGLVGVLVDKGPKAQFKEVMQQNQINMADIMRKQFTTQLVEAGIFPAIVPEGGDAQFKLEVRDFGFVSIVYTDNGWALKPILDVRGSLVRPDGTILWQHRHYITALHSFTPPARHFESYVGNPELIREALTAAAKFASEDFIKNMRQE